MNRKKNRLKALLFSFLLFITGAALMLAIAYVMKCEPFGTATLGGGDINISQIDQYSYLKDILDGKNTLGYSFSMGLGGDTANVFAYGMGSPLNLFVYFFEKSQMNIFFTFLTVVKIGLCAATACYFLQERFDYKLKFAILFILSMGYAFSEYGMSQIVNIFYLDGMIMLPLIILGAYRVLEDRSASLFILSIAISVICNWYTGAINCLFVICWFLFEYALRAAEKKECGLIHFLKKTGICMFGGITAVLISCIILLPVVNAVQNGNRGSFNWDYFTNTMRGNVLNVISSNLIGVGSTEWSTALYCGCAALVAIAVFFVSRKIRPSIKIVNALFLAFLIMSFYWQPLHMVFSLFKHASSFWCRYSYIGIISLLFMAAEYFVAETEERENCVIYTGVLYAGFLCLMCLASRTDYKKEAILTVGMILLMTLTLAQWFASEGKKKSILSVLLMLFTCCELFLNGYYEQKQYINEGMDIQDAYITVQEERITKLQSDDPGYYRIGEGENRKMHRDNCTASYNEPLGYHYWGITAYTNSPDDRQRKLLDHLGYRINGENFYIVNTSIVSADALLGMKYFMSSYEINGLVELSEYGIVNNKKMYENPFALPMVYTLSLKSSDPLDQELNPFEYQNALYKKLTGSSADLFEKVSFTCEGEDKDLLYTLQLKDGNYAYYGNIAWDHYMYATIYDENDELITGYSKWCSPSVFYIPVTEGAETTSVHYVMTRDPAIKEEQFYALNLDTLKKMTDTIKEGNQVTDAHIENEYVKITVDCDKATQLMTSLPADSGWKITDNGETIEPELLEDCLMYFNLTEGTHVIEMTYRLPGLVPGIIASALGVVLLIVYMVLYRKKGKEETGGLE